MDEQPQVPAQAVAKLAPEGLSTELSFVDKITSVDTALKDRSAAQKTIKLKYAEVVKLMTKYAQTVPARRPASPDTVASWVQHIEVLKPLDSRLEDTEAVRVANAVRWTMPRGSDSDDSQVALTAVEKQFPGYDDWMKRQHELYRLANQGRKRDEQATKAAKAEVQAAVDAYLEAVEKYDETVESVANVKEYVSVVKDIAEISAISKGVARD